MPVVAECAGLLWLGADLDGHPQCGVLPASARMTGKLTLGYREAVAVTSSPLAAAGTTIRAHEFHRTVSEPASDATPAWRLTDGRVQGWATDRLLASYLHVHWAGLPAAAPRLLAAAQAAQPAKGAQAARGARGAKAARGAEAVQSTGAARTAPPAARTNVTGGPLVTLEQHQSSDDHDVCTDLAPTGTLTHATPAAPTTLSTAAAPSPAAQRRRLGRRIPGR